MVVETLKLGNTTAYIHDDFIDEKNIEPAMEHISDIVSEYLIKKFQQQNPISNTSCK